MAINPVRFAHQICDEFLRDIFAAGPLSDFELAQQARRLLERRSSLDIPQVHGPFISQWYQPTSRAIRVAQGLLPKCTAGCQRPLRLDQTGRGCSDARCCRPEEVPRRRSLKSSGKPQRIGLDLARYRLERLLWPGRIGEYDPAIG
jgi:hypothetical protein